MAKRDYYDVLSVDRGASKDDIKKAYRKLAVKYHPDQNPGDKTAEERFKEATEAYEVLADEKKRQAYDQFGFAGVDGMQSSGNPHDYSAFRDFSDIFGDFSGIFDSFFGGGGPRGRGRQERSGRGADLRYDLDVDFVDAAFGTKVEIAYDRNVHCEQCKGSGAEDGSGRRTCPTCGGAGQVRRSSGFFSLASTCPTCSGTGTVLEHPCSACSGRGTVTKRQKIKVTIPAGIETGKRINIPGQGDAGQNGGPAGDLYVFIQVKPHRFFERDGVDLYCALPVSITQASLGAEVHVPTLDGRRVKLRIPAGTQNGKMLRLRGEGVPVLNNSSRRGDLYIRVHVRVPERLTMRAKSILRDFAQVQGEDEDPEPIPLAELR